MQEFLDKKDAILTVLFYPQLAELIMRVTLLPEAKILDISNHLTLSSPTCMMEINFKIYHERDIICVFWNTQVLQYV